MLRPYGAVAHVRPPASASVAAPAAASVVHASRPCPHPLDAGPFPTLFVVSFGQEWKEEFVSGEVVRMPPFQTGSGRLRYTKPSEDETRLKLEQHL